MIKEREFLGTEDIKKLLIKLSIPSIVNLLIGGFYNLIDTIFIGKGVGEDGLAAVGYTFPLIILNFSIMILLAVGGSSAVSRKLGEGDIEKVNTTIGNMNFIAIFFGGALIIFELLFSSSLLRIFSTPEHLIDMANSYFRVFVISDFVYMFVFPALALMRSEGKAFNAMIFGLIGTVINIVLDLLFIYDVFTFNFFGKSYTIQCLGLGIKGAALATLIGRTVALVCVIIYFSGKKRTVYNFAIKYLKPKRDYLIDIIKTGLASFLRNVVASFMLIFININLTKIGGDNAISSYMVVNRTLHFLVMPLFGISQGAAAIIGYNYGAKKYDRLIHTANISMIVGTIYLIITITIGYLMREPIVGLFIKEGSDSVTSALSTKGMSIVFIGMYFLSLAVVYPSMLQCMGNGIKASFYTLLRDFFTVIPFIYIGLMLFPGSIEVIWYSIALGTAVTGIVCITMYYFEVKKLKSMIISN